MAMDEPVRAWLDVAQAGQQWRVQPMLSVAAPMRLRYVLEAEKTGPSGNTRSNQSDDALFESDETRQLATLQMSLQPADRLHVKLMVFEGDRMVAERSWDRPAMAGQPGEQ